MLYNFDVLLPAVQLQVSVGASLKMFMPLFVSVMRLSNTLSYLTYLMVMNMMLAIFNFFAFR